MCVFIYFLKIYVNLIYILSCLDLFLMQSISEIIYRTFHSRLGCDCQSDIYSFSYFFRIFICIISASFLADYEGNSCHTFCCFFFSACYCTLRDMCHLLDDALNLQPYILPRWLVWPGLGCAVLANI